MNNQPTPDVEEIVEEFWDKARDQDNDWFYEMSVETRQLFYNWISRFLPELLTTLTQQNTRKIEEAVEGERKAKLRKEDIGDKNYLVAREAVAEISGMPLMALTFDQHLDVIKRKLQTLTDTKDI